MKRRTNVVGIFANEEAVARLVGAVPFERNDEWATSRRCMPVETLRAVCQSDDAYRPAAIAAA